MLDSRHEYVLYVWSIRCKSPRGIYCTVRTSTGTCEIYIAQELADRESVNTYSTNRVRTGLLGIKRVVTYFCQSTLCPRVNMRPSMLEISRCDQEA